MKNKNQRELEKHWAQKQKKAEKPNTSALKKKSREDGNQAAARIVKDGTEV